MGRCVRLMEGAFPPGGACISAWPARGRLDALSVSCGVPWAMCMHAGAQPACAPLCVRTALPVACLLCGGARGWSPSASGPARPASSSVRLHDGASRVACGRSGERPGLAARSQFYAWVGTRLMETRLCARSPHRAVRPPAACLGWFGSRTCRHA
jgi:hypothetical protein